MRILLISILIIILTPAAQAHLVPYTDLYTSFEKNTIQFEIFPPVLCSDKDCKNFIYHNYSIKDFENKLTIKNDEKKCNLNKESFLNRFNKTSGDEYYYIEYDCENRLEILNITNYLFYDMFGYYFEQYYILNCSGDTNVFYTDLIEPDVIINYSEICFPKPPEQYFTATEKELPTSPALDKPALDKKQETKKDIYDEKADLPIVMENKMFSTESIINNIVNFSRSENFIIYVILLSILFGIIHSFSPGHGKSLILSYILGHKTDSKDILLLSLTTAITHISDIFILSLIFLILPMSLKNQYMNSITLAASVLIIIFGLKSLYDTLRKKHTHTHSHKEAGSHEHHFHTHEHKQPKTNKRSILTFGILAGLAPCPTAWTLFSILIALKLYSYAFISILSFSVGLILTILSISLVLLKAKTLFRYIPNEIKGYNYLQIISSLLVITIGVFMLIQFI
ncbi:MAG: sulfite exporter TauE/SafE family protein [archaeon]|nr:sulfite exporter TauE/SafE family protein [archaeon]